MSRGNLFAMKISETNFHFERKETLYTLPEEEDRQRWHSLGRTV